MDMLTLQMLKKYVDQKSGESTEQIEEELELVSLDKDIAVELLMNAVRQNQWSTEDALPVCEEGTVTLTNTQKFPFNNSEQTVALVTTQEDTSYFVVTELVSEAGTAGEVIVSGKQTNGFKLAYTGSASSAVVHYFVIGGIIS